MGLKVIYGRASAGKTEFCFREIEELLAKDGEKELVFIVPDQIAMSEEKAAVKRFGAVGINGIEVFNFRWYYEKLSELEPGRTREELTNVGRAMVIKRILNEKKTELEIYKLAAEKRGFISTVEKTFREFKRYDVHGETLKTLVAEGIRQGKVDEKTKDLAHLFSEYEKKIEGRYLDSDDSLNRLAEILNRKFKEEQRQKIEGKPLPFRRYWIDGFKDFTPQELKVLEAILESGYDLTVTLCTDFLTEKENIRVDDIFATAKRTFCNLEKMAGALGLKPEIVGLSDLDENCDDYGKNCRAKSEQLRFLEKEFFSEIKAPYTGESKDIEIFEAKEIWNEIDYIARKIVKLCREEGYKYNEISVVTGDLENYSRFLENVFKLYDIPIFLDEKKKIANHPLITVVTGVFSVFETNWSYESVFRLLKSGYWGMTPNEVDVLENFCLKYGIKGELLRSNNRWAMIMKQMEARKDVRENLQQIQNLRTLAVTDLDEFYGSWKGKKKGKELVAAFYSFLEDSGVLERVVSETEEFINNGDENGAALQEKTWGGLLNIFEQISEIIGDELIELSEFGELLELGFMELGAGMAPVSVDQVLVGDLDRSRHHKVKALFVMGMNEDTFPASIPKTAIINDNERKYLEEKGCRLAPDTTSAIFEKEYLVYRTFSAPEEKLFLSYPVADLSGGAKRPARAIKELRVLFKEMVFFSELTSAEAPMDLVSKPGPTLGKIFDTLSERKPLSKELSEAMNWFEKNSEWKNRGELLKSALSYTTQTEGVNGDALKIMAGGDLFSSISKLEAYGKCPFSWFVEGALRAKDREIFQLNMMDIGNFIHEILYDTITTASSMGKTIGEISDADLEAISEKIFLKKSEEGIMASKGRYKYLSSRIHRVAKRSLKMINEHFRRSQFKNYGNELEFGNNSRIGEAGIRMSDGSFLRLRGRIDRLDVFQQNSLAYCRIVDYKTGNKALSMSDVYYGLELQLLGYMNSLVKNGVEGLDKILKPAAAMYLRLDEPLLEGEKDANPEDVEKAILKRLRMSGVAINDSEIFLALDNFAESKESSMDISERKGLVSEEQMASLCSFAERKIKESGEQIKKGYIKAEPICREGEYHCIYCRYRSVCKFDEEIEGNRGRLIRKLPDGVALEKILKAEEEQKNG